MTESRKSFRYPAHIGQREVLLWRNGESFAAAVIDESAGGVGVIVAEPTPLRPGDVIEYEDRQLALPRQRAIVSFVQPEPDGIIRVGLRWR